MIPRSFVRDYEKFLSSSICIKLPDCREWKVGLTKASNGAVWMENGWHEFAEHYRLEFGSFLVFRYDGDSTFHTTIFHKNGSEIKYGTIFEASEEGDDISPQPKKKKPSFSPDVHIRIEKSFCPKREPQRKKGAESSCKKRESKQEDVVTKKKEEAISDKRTEQLGAGFKAVMKRTNVGGRLDMITPKTIAVKYLAEEKGLITVQTSNHKTWSLLYTWSLNQPNSAFISTGWNRFTEDNHLQHGDIGFFQFIQQRHFFFTKLQQPNTNQFTTNPSFQIHFHRNAYRTILTIPNGFSKHLSPRMHTVTLQVGNKQWEVKLKQYDNRFRFSGGWVAFYKDNRLEDTSCFFEMVNKKCFLFNVTIFNHISSISSSEEN